MTSSSQNANIITQAAITVLMYAYEQSSDKVVKESIYSAAKAIIQMNRDLETNCTQNSGFECDCDYDPSDYCAAI
jgi:hypothetical protein